MLNDQIKQLLNAPQLTRTEQGVDTYPRVIRQDNAGEGHMIVTFALPGLRRARMWVPIDRWVDGQHLDAHAAMMCQQQRERHPIRPDAGDSGA